MLDLNGSLITRQHVMGLLPIMGLTREREERLLALPYPVDFRSVAAVFRSVGIDADTLIDRMGASP